MRECCGQDWLRFYPKTNAQWMHYVFEKLVTTKSPKVRNQLLMQAQSALDAIASAPNPDGAVSCVSKGALKPTRKAEKLVKKWRNEFAEADSATAQLWSPLLRLPGYGR
ncbi:hypothetical protein EV182_006376 [Spiromyces aspiralis]|uniref:Uncharacterized protein n=1 Tax=Spiromyces aspiralis TaxID=68401 RepID=A0ACC1HMV6_9FUNG|nr:hypothetical protein EV182_006376 [Spiromyces aspiralis]